MPAMKEGAKIEEAAAALMDLARVEKQQKFAPCSRLDMQRLGVDCGVQAQGNRARDQAGFRFQGALSDRNAGFYHGISEGWHSKGHVLL
jgi:hypothetical protein